MKEITINDFSNEELIRAIVRWIRVKDEEDSYSPVELSYMIEDGSWLSSINEELKSEN